MTTFGIKPIRVMIHNCSGVMLNQIFNSQQGLGSRYGIELIQILPFPVIIELRCAM
ncbi:hypothetical protein [Nitrosomonas eutropha]|uniref:hypothetical protein n=1 Tax=Nitrosomonas eutropha TaxID=916 RepID=UPI0015A03AAF|nr:hypothetical protein [Nitrosomonas eutropha]